MSGRQDTQAIYRRAGFTGALEPGDRPAVLVVDYQVGFTDPARSSLAGDFSRELEATGQLLAAARAQGLPVFFTSIAYEEHLRDAGLWVHKVPSLAELRFGTPLIDIDPRLERRHDETVVYKKYASAFIGTSLASSLTAAGVDTLYVAGCTTSGCVRASVVDALQYGFRPFVVRDAVADRAEEPHRANLFDMQSKYAEVITLETALEQIEGLKRRQALS